MKKFLLKLTENYLNAVMVLVLVVLAIHAIVYRDAVSAVLAVVWVLSIPFLGTFIDMRSNR